MYVYINKISIAVPYSFLQKMKNIYIYPLLCSVLLPMWSWSKANKKPEILCLRKRSRVCSYLNLHGISCHLLFIRGLHYIHATFIFRSANRMWDVFLCCPYVHKVMKHLDLSHIFGFAIKALKQLPLIRM